MRLSKVKFKNYRSFKELEWHPQSGIHIIYGPNGSGKSNLLEGISTLSSTRSPRINRDVELINWQSLEMDPLPGAFMSADKVNDLQSPTSHESVEISVTAQNPVDQSNSNIDPYKIRTVKQYRRNGQICRASQVIGCVRSVLFSARDLRLIEGTPAERRKYIDTTLSQIDPHYIGALRDFSRVLENRNALLRGVNKGSQTIGSLDVWDEQFASTGARIMFSRSQHLATLLSISTSYFIDLNPGEFANESRLEYLPNTLIDNGSSQTDIYEQMLSTLRNHREVDSLRGTTTRGPHRDDLKFEFNKVDAAVSASRGQLRSLALSLRLAEVNMSEKQTGEKPVLLLDDVLSELDLVHRERVMDLTLQADQAIIATPDPERPNLAILADPSNWHLETGELIEQL